MTDNRHTADAKVHSVPEDAAVTNFREYLRIKTVQPHPDYGLSQYAESRKSYVTVDFKGNCCANYFAASSTAFLKRQANELGLPVRCIEVAPGYEVVVITWVGSDTELTSIMLNSHVDVVPVFPEKWKYDPFQAVKTENGDIFARGTQDMKCVGIQYLEAIRRLKQSGFKPLRTIHVTFVPDEEIGGSNGMAKFVETDVFLNLNVGLALDEGLANPDERFKVFYAERVGTAVEVTCEGNPGHASRLVENTAADKLRKIVNLFLEFRDQEKDRLKNNPELTLGDVVSVNLTLLKGGVQVNVIPSEFKAVFDIRVPPTKVEEVKQMVNSWIAQCGEGVTCIFLYKSPRPPAKVTSTDENDPWWRAFSGVLNDMKLKYDVEIFSAGTDSRYIRGKGYPALGFSPMNNTPVLLHDHNEYLNEKIFLEGINIYYRLVSALSTVPRF